MADKYGVENRYTIQTKNSGGADHVVTKVVLIPQNQYAGKKGNIPGSIRRRMIREGSLPNPITPREWKINEYYVPVMGSWYEPAPKTYVPEEISG